MFNRSQHLSLFDTQFEGRSLTFKKSLVSYSDMETHPTHMVPIMEDILLQECNLMTGELVCFTTTAKS